MSAPRRPLSLTITALGIFLLAMWNLWRAWIVAQQGPLLEQIGVTLDPRARLLMSLVWALVFLLMGLALWRRLAVVRVLLPVAVFFYGVYHLLLLFLFAPAPAARQGWPMQLLLLVAATAWITWICWRPAHHDLWQQGDQDAAGRYPLSPLTFKVVQRGNDGESKD